MQRADFFLTSSPKIVECINCTTASEASVYYYSTWSLFGLLPALISSTYPYSRNRIPIGIFLLCVLLPPFYFVMLFYIFLFFVCLAPPPPPIVVEQHSAVIIARPINSAPRAERMQARQ